LAQGLCIKDRPSSPEPDPIDAMGPSTPAWTVKNTFVDVRDPSSQNCKRQLKRALSCGDLPVADHDMSRACGDLPDPDISTAPHCHEASPPQSKDGDATQRDKSPWLPTVKNTFVEVIDISTQDCRRELRPVLSCGDLPVSASSGFHGRHPLFASTLSLGAASSDMAARVQVVRSTPTPVKNLARASSIHARTPIQGTSPKKTQGESRDIHTPVKAESKLKRFGSSALAGPIDEMPALASPPKSSLSMPRGKKTIQSRMKGIMGRQRFDEMLASVMHDDESSSSSDDV